MEQGFVLLPSTDKSEREIHLDIVNDFNMGGEVFTIAAVKSLRISMSDKYHFMGDKGEVGMILSPKKKWKCFSITLHYSILQGILLCRLFSRSIKQKCLEETFTTTTNIFL